MKKSEIKQIIELVVKNELSDIYSKIKYNNNEDKVYILSIILDRLLSLSDINKNTLSNLYYDIFINISLLSIKKNTKIIRFINNEKFIELMPELVNKENFKERFLIIYSKNNSYLNSDQLSKIEGYLTEEEIKKYENVKINDLIKEELQRCLTNNTKDSYLLDENYLSIVDLCLNTLSDKEILNYNKKIGILIYHIDLSFKSFGLKKEHILNIYKNIKVLIKDKNRKEIVKILYRSNLKEECFEYLSFRKVVIADIFDIIKFDNEEILKIFKLYENINFKKNAYRLYTMFKNKNMLIELLKYNIIDLESKEFNNHKELKEKLKMIKILEDF